MAMRMDYDVMEQRAKEFQNHADAVSEVINKMDNLLRTLESEWEGAAANSFSARYNELKPNFIKVRDLIGEISGKLSQSAKATREHDQNMKF